MIFIPTVVEPTPGILAETPNPSFHIFWPVNRNSRKPVEPYAQTIPAPSGLKSAIARPKPAFAEIKPAIPKMDSAIPKPGKAFTKPIPAIPKMKTAFAKPISAIPKLEKAFAETISAIPKMISGDRFGAKNIKKPGFMRDAGTALNTGLNATD
jgi:hypothetical protein